MVGTVMACYVQSQCRAPSPNARTLQSRTETVKQHWFDDSVLTRAFWVLITGGFFQVLAKITHFSGAVFMITYLYGQRCSVHSQDIKPHMVRHPADSMRAASTRRCGYCPLPGE